MTVASLFGAAIVGNEASQSAANVVIGESVPAGHLHLISHPGRYGLGPEVPGSQYAIVDNLLVRIDPETQEIQSIIRPVDKILD